MSNEKYTGQNAGTQALQDFFADMATGFAVQEQVADTTIVELDEGAELKGVLIQYDVAGSGAGYDLKKWVANFNRLTKYERANTLVALERIKDKDVKVFFDAAKSASDWDDIEAIMASAKKHADKNSKPMFEGLDESVEEIDVSDFKARAKKLGYKVKTKSYSDFSTATVINVKTGNEVGSVSSSGASITKGLMDDDNTEYYKMANKVKVTDGMRRVTIPRHSGITESSELSEAQQKELAEVTKAHAEIADHSKRSKEELDQRAQMRRERDKRLAAMGVKTKRLVKEGEESEDTDLVEATGLSIDRAIKFIKSKLSADEIKKYGEDGIKHVAQILVDTGNKKFNLKESLDEAKRKYDMSTYAISLYKAAYNLFDDGLKESDAEAAGKMLNAKAHNGYITMEDLTDIAKHFGLAVGSGLFKEGFEHADKQVEELTEADLQELFTFFKKETKPVAAIDMGGDDVTEKWTPNIESMVFGKYSFMLWKNKTKSEWYGLAYNTRNGETKKTLESSTSKSAIIKQLKAMVTGHEPVTEETEAGVDADPKTVINSIIEKYQTAKTKSAELVIEGLEQLIEYIAEETPPLEATSSDWSPEQETLVRGKNTLVMWKNKTKSEWYGYSYNTRTGELLVSITRKTKPEVVLDLRKFAVDLPVTE